MNKDKMLLFIPGYNCEKQILRVLSQINEPVLEFVDEVIMVNNISTDNTEQTVLQFGNEHPHIPLTLLRNNENYGLGGSHKTAFKYAVENDFDYVIVLHGDDQGNINDILPILEKGIHKKYDCCLGARFKRGSKLQGYSKFRTLGNIVYNILFSIVIRKKVYDLGSGLNIYNTSILKNEFYIKFQDNLTFNCYMLLASNYYKHNISFFPISWREDDQVSNVKMASQAISTLKLLMEYFIDKDNFIKKEHRTNKITEYRAEKISKTNILNNGGV